MSEMKRESVSTTDRTVPLGELPPIGEVPKTMTALVVRQDRFGDPEKAFQVETDIEVPPLGPSEVLVAVMAAGVNYNNVWAARGYPVDVIGMRQRAGEPYDFHIGGSDASGIVYAVGSEVSNVAVGDEVIVHPGYWDENDPWITRGKDQMVAPSARIWGYDTNFGSFAQFARAQAHQVLPKAGHLSWAEAAAPTLVGTTAYRMLHGFAGNTVQEGDVVLVWGGSGGLGTQAIQLANLAGAKPVAVVSDDERGEYALAKGALGYIKRGDYTHWGIPPLVDDKAGQKEWLGQARAFGKKIWEIVGERKDPAIVFEHPGAATVPTSIMVCEPGGMVVICAGTTGFDAMVDLRYHWTRQKRFQGSHGTNDAQAVAYNDLVIAGKIDPCLGRVVEFTDLPRVHAEMGRGEQVFGNSVALVGAKPE
ncbi:crotonyl-CoA carboxylase/reductase [Streptosporangium amethystogenes]|uniref:crotonyl-CoA carboxylase/reductase n=1 Tax=Streptosporangium amethystogenes TaxID=2002 RepID=UPI003610D36D